MMKEIPIEIIEAFTGYGPLHEPAGTINAKPINGGLINHSYRISSEHKQDILLQKINKNVFPRPDHVQENYMAIWEYLNAGPAGLQLPSPKRCSKGNTFMIDRNKNYWRAFDFIENSCMHPVAENPGQANDTSRAFARFTSSLIDFNTSHLYEVIPGFHNLSHRYSQFEEALNGKSHEQTAIASPVIEELKQREQYKKFYETIEGSSEFPLRVMHHDAKIANVLFNSVSGKVICLVDFDTIMPGYFFSDLGDMIRSMACCENEESDNFNNICIRKDFYDSIVTGYLDVIGNQLTPAEKRHIHYSGLLMSYMQALRFLTDYLNGNVYYQTRYPDHNFIRAKNQLILLQKLEEFLHKHYNFRHD